MYIGHANGRQVTGKITREVMEGMRANPAYKFITWQPVDDQPVKLSPEVAETIRPAKAEAEEDKPKRRKKS